MCGCQFRQRKKTAHSIRCRLGRSGAENQGVSCNRRTGRQRHLPRKRFSGTQGPCAVCLLPALHDLEINLGASYLHDKRLIDFGIPQSTAARSMSTATNASYCRRRSGLHPQRSLLADRRYRLPYQWGAFTLSNTSRDHHYDPDCDNTWLTPAPTASLPPRTAPCRSSSSAAMCSVKRMVGSTRPS